MSKFKIEDWNDNDDLKRADKAQFAIKFVLERDCYVEVWMRHSPSFLYDKLPTLAEKVVSEKLDAGSATIVVNADDYINRQYSACVLIYSCESGNTIAQDYDIPVDELNDMMLIAEC